jgi:uncharacterized iron-regulated protein
MLRPRSPWAPGALLVVAAACTASATRPFSAASPFPSPPASLASPPLASPPGHESWQSRLDAAHPLVGSIWDVAARRRVPEAQLAARVGASEVVLVGEIHDNPDHHRLEARLLRAFAAHHPSPSVVFEMLDREQQATVDAALREHPGDADALSRAVGWESTGWPPWPVVRPVFEAAIEVNAALLAGEIRRPSAMRIATQGPAAVDPLLDRTFDLHDPPPPDEQAALRREMAEAHCGLLPEDMLDAMALVQRTRDALLAELVHRGAARGHGALLVAGDGHVRRDRGVPAQLARAYRTASLAIGLLEVQKDLTRPEAYAGAFDARELPFDVVWFTPRVSDADHCAEIRRHSGI